MAPPPFCFCHIINVTMKQSISKKQSPLKRMSLKESHRRRMLLAEKHERELIIAEATAAMILEALDNDDIGNATKVLKKLNAISKFAPDSLKAAIKTAADEVNDFTGGGLGALMKKAGSWLAKKFGAKAGTNPILKALILLNALERGFFDATDVITNNAPDYDGNSDKSLMDQVDDNAAKNLRKILAKAFEPEGVFAKIKSLFGSTGGIPYVKDVNKMVEDIMMLPAKQLTSLIQAATTGESSEKAAEAAKDMTAAAQGKGSEGSAQVKKGAEQPVKSVDDLAKAVAAGQTEKKGEDTGAAVEKAQENPKAVVKQFVDYVQKQSNQNADVVQKVLNALVKNGKLKSTFSVVEGKTRLTMSDVLDAQMALLECGGSSAKWVEILFEASKKGNEKFKQNLMKKIESGEIKDEKTLEAQLNQNKSATLSQQARKELKDAIKNKGKSGGGSAESSGGSAESASSGGDSASEAGASKEQPDSKHATTIKAIQNDLKDVDVKAIEAVLDAIPDYLKVENAKFFLSRSSRVI